MDVEWRDNGFLTGLDVADVIGVSGEASRVRVPLLILQYLS